MQTFLQTRTPLLMMALGLALCLQTPALAQTAPLDPGSMAFEMALMEAQAPQDRLALVETAIAAVEASAEPDYRMYFDLNDLRLDLLIELARTAEAATLAASLSAFALENSGLLNADPIFYARHAAALFEEAGNQRVALQQLEAEAKLRLESGETGESLARVYRDMQRLAAARGDSGGAATYAELAENATDSQGAAVNKRGDTGYSEVDVFYATDRARSGSADPNKFYSAGRGDLEYGTVTVSIPKTHEPGAIELPSIWRLEFGATPAKHVMLRRVIPQDSAEFFASMQERVAKSPRKEAFVFVHGFNTTFDAASRRAAQLAYDMNYSGVPILYSWPSAGKTFSYVADTAVVRLSGRRLALFLEDLHANSGADTIHIVAHSMGNRALTDALELLALKTRVAEGGGPMFGQLFFAAPDVDAGLFQEMMKTIRPIGERLTLYASDVDWALEASRKLHGYAPRAGQAGDNILVATEFDTVDMSMLGDDMLAHTYFANDSSAITDIASLIWRSPDPVHRCGLVNLQEQGNPEIWHYEKGACQVGKLVALISQLWNLGPVDAQAIKSQVRALVSDPNEAAELERRLVDMIATE
ncbi:alpha/beta hydrolase [Lentibacter sp. XHP0401]|uniref:alpha/beta hydrolase n=1 Tax=Lentibacter sp. XHP0401 TaxID=2984334 RepID=UPI0021E909B4|nr:alpha/beta hydrolase [Lentibacter sp. XHP0401]MCV2894625.1 alpha/beta hydrolase [Lentibacter sp. XHP0401]